MSLISNSGLFQLQILPKDNWDLTPSPLAYHANLNGIHDKKRALKLIGKACHFPDWYGESFDALFDCLTDWRGINVIYIDNSKAWRTEDNNSYQICLQVLRDACEYIEQSGGVLSVYIDDPHLPNSPI